MNRTISKWQKVVIFLTIFPRSITELLLIAGIAIPIFTYPGREAWFGLILLTVAAFLALFKIKKVKKVTYVLNHGIRTEAELTRISDTQVEINDRALKIYNFQYTADGRRFNYEYESARLQRLSIGQKLNLYYLENHPRVIVIPELYHIRC